MATLPDWLTVSPSSGKGADEINIEASANEGCDRSAEISFTPAGGSPVTLTVAQEGRREPLRASDGDFTLSGGGTFNVLKNS